MLLIVLWVVVAVRMTLALAARSIVSARAPALLVVAVLSLACNSRSSAPATRGRGETTEESPLGILTDRFGLDAAAAIVDLLRVTPSLVSVSSRSDGPRDFPEHLVDGNPETAWKTRNGDIVGAWVAFRVPDDAYVSHVMMSVGSERQSAGRDYFMEGPRITSVRVYRHNRRVSDVSLDPTMRQPQRIEINQPGGDFKIMVTSVVDGPPLPPHGLAVSQLSVMGTVSSTVRRQWKAPPVQVGQLGPMDVTTSTFPAAPSVLRSCEDFIRYNDTALDEDRGSPWRSGAEPAAPTRCQPARETQGMAPPFTLTARIDIEQDLVGPDAVTFRGAVLGVEMPGHFFQTDVRIAGEERSGATRTTYTLLGLDNPRWKDSSRIVVQVLETRIGDDEPRPAIRRAGGDAREQLTHVGSVCTLAPGKPAQLTCTTTRSRILGGRAPAMPSQLSVSDAGDVSFLVGAP